MQEGNINMKYILLLLLCSGCVSTTMTHGIPNFRPVDAKYNVYRGGQPTKEGWDWLRAQGVKWDLKLNTWKEAPEPELFTNTEAIWIDYEPITLEEQLMLYANKYSIDEAVQSLIDRPTNLYIHCEHGQDRTGLLCAIFRVKVQNWTKQQAEDEMLKNGFHKELLGLWSYWKNLK